MRLLNRKNFFTIQLKSNSSTRRNLDYRFKFSICNRLTANCLKKFKTIESFMEAERAEVTKSWWISWRNCKTSIVSWSSRMSFICRKERSCKKLWRVADRLWSKCRQKKNTSKRSMSHWRMSLVLHLYRLILPRRIDQIKTASAVLLSISKAYLLLKIESHSSRSSTLIQKVVSDRF